MFLIEIFSNFFYIFRLLEIFSNFCYIFRLLEIFSNFLKYFSPAFPRSACSAQYLLIYLTVSVGSAGTWSAPKRRVWAVNPSARYYLSQERLNLMSSFKLLVKFEYSFNNGTEINGTLISSPGNKMFFLD